jgi:hypothetical protein
MQRQRPFGLLAFLRREAAWLALGAGLGLIVLPMAVYEIGSRTLGPYEGAGAPTLAANVYSDFLHLRLQAWILVLGPLAVIYALRLCVRAFRRNAPVSGGARASADQPGAARDR